MSLLRSYALRTARPLLVATAFVALAAGTATAQTAGGPGGGLLGGNGKLVSRSGSTLQIEGRVGTSKVLVTSSTDYEQIEDTDASAITVGTCVRVNGSGSADDGITATSVSVMAADACNGSPNGAAGGGAGRQLPNGGSFPNGGQLPNGGSLPNGGQLPNGGSLPNGGQLPNGGSFPNGGSLPSGGFAGMGGNVTGVVKQVDGATVVVKAQVPQQPTKSGGRITTKKQKVTVTLGDDVTVMHTVPATESALVVGSCVSAQGSADSVGTVTATTVTVSEAVDGECTGGFGGPGGGTFSGPPVTGATT